MCRLLVCVLRKQAVKHTLFTFWELFRRSSRRLGMPKCAILLTLRRLMSYIYIYMEHPFLMFLDHTQRRSTIGRTPLDE